MGPCTPPASGPLDCEYGGNAFGQCATLASCTQQVGSPGVWNWYVTQPAPGCGQNSPSCPAAFGMSEGQACPVQSECQYDQGACGCISCVGDAGQSGYWHCRSWSDVGPNCPAPRPLLGTVCNLADGTRCDYSQCCGGPSLGRSTTCVGGTWENVPTGGCSCVIQSCP